MYFKLLLIEQKNSHYTIKNLPFINLKEDQHPWLELECVQDIWQNNAMNFLQISRAALDHSTCFSYSLLFSSNLFNFFLFLQCFGSLKFINIWEVSNSLIHFSKIWLKQWRNTFYSNLYICVMNSTKSEYLEVRLAFAKGRWLYVGSWLRPDNFL